MDVFAFGGSCVLAALSTEVTSEDGAWREAARAQVGADGICPWVDVLLPADVQMGELSARVVLTDGTRRKVIGPRMERRPRDVSGLGAVRLHTPDLIPGDTLLVEVERVWDASDWAWSDAFTRTSEPLPGLPAVPAEVTLLEELQIPGDFQRSLYPGGGSSRRLTWTVDLAVEDRARAILLSVPESASNLQIDGSHVRWDDTIVLTAPAGEAAHTVVSWVEPDARTHGLKASLPGATLTHVIQAPDGRVRWQDDGWWLASLGLRAVTPPERADLVRALSGRFLRAALPEPALPAFLRGRAGDLELAAALRPALLDRAGVADLPVDPLFPRRLIKARGTGAISSVEASLILALQLEQARIPATWAIARPASEGPGFHTSPAGYRVGLTAFQSAGPPDGSGQPTRETRWIDPSCRVCAPFELPPDLEGADVISPVADQTPTPREGRLTVTDTDSERRVRLEGPAALELRLLLASAPADGREALLAERFGGPGAKLTSSVGLAEPGAPAELVVVPGDDPPDPLAPPAGTWWGWIGERVWSRPATDALPAHVHEGPLCWTARTDAGVHTETLTVADRRVPADTTRHLTEQWRRDIPRNDERDSAPSPEAARP